MVAVTAAVSFALSVSTRRTNFRLVGFRLLHTHTLRASEEGFHFESRDFCHTAGKDAAAAQQLPFLSFPAEFVNVMSYYEPLEGLLGASSSTTLCVLITSSLLLI